MKRLARYLPRANFAQANHAFGAGLGFGDDFSGDNAADQLLIANVGAIVLDDDEARISEVIKAPDVA